MSEGLIDLKSVAKDWLGKSERGVRKDIACGVFGPDLIRLGRSVRVRVQELREWIDAGCPPRDEWVRTRKTKNSRAVSKGEGARR